MNYAKPETVRLYFKDTVPNILVMMINSMVDKHTIHLFLLIFSFRIRVPFTSFFC